MRYTDRRFTYLLTHYIPTTFGKCSEYEWEIVRILKVYDLTSKIRLRQSMRTYSKNERAKFHPYPV